MPGRRKKKTTPRRKNFIKIKRPGAFTRYCAQVGFAGPSQACIDWTLLHGPPLRRREASLARTFKKWGKARHARAMRTK